MDRIRRIVGWIGERLRPGPTYRCSGCSLSFDRDRLNCPACGSPEVTAVRDRRPGANR